MCMNFWSDWFKTESQSKSSALYWGDLARVKDRNGFKTNWFNLKRITRSDVKIKLKA